MRKLACLLFVVATAFSMFGCSGGGAEEAVSDKPAGDITTPGEGGPKRGAGAAMAAPEPTPPPASN
jgi:hypothetical protein